MHHFVAAVWLSGNLRVGRSLTYSVATSGPVSTELRLRAIFSYPAKLSLAIPSCIGKHIPAKAGSML